MNTDHEVFWLARYAHNTLAPLFAEVKAIEPSIRFSIEMAFQNPDRPHTRGSINVYGHWDRESMFLYQTQLGTKAAIDKLALQIKDKIDKLKVPGIEDRRMPGLTRGDAPAFA